MNKKPLFLYFLEYKIKDFIGKNKERYRNLLLQSKIFVLLYWKSAIATLIYILFVIITSILIYMWG